MASFRFHTRVAAGPDEVWAVLSDVATIPQWFPGIVAAREQDGYRILTTPGPTMRARVVTCDPVLRRFQYSFVEGMPQPIEFHLGTLDVIDEGEGTLIVYSQQIEPEELGPHVGSAVAGGIQGIADYFADRA